MQRFALVTCTHEESLDLNLYDNFISPQPVLAVILQVKPRAAVRRYPGCSRKLQPSSWAGTAVPAPPLPPRSRR